MIINEDIVVETIPYELVRLWQEDKVTKAFILLLENAVEEAEKQGQRRDFITDPKGQLNLNYWLGYKEGVSGILQIFTKQFIEEAEE